MDKINLTKSYAKLNESLAKQFDGSGVKRSFTVPYTAGAPMSDHIAAVGQAASQSGGLTSNLLTSFHHSEGKGWGSDEGSTQGHPSDKLRTTIIPKDDENAKATIEAAQKHLDNIGKLIGDDNPAVVQANSQLNLVKKSNAAGMSLLDFGVMMTQIMHRPTQMVAQAHDQTKQGGMHPKLRGPAAETPPEATETASGAPQTEGEAQPAQPEAQAAQNASGGESAAPEAAQA